MATRAKKTAIIGTLAEWNQLDSSVGIIVVKSGVLNDPSLVTMDMARFVHLSRFVVGDESCMYVSELKLIGLNELESVEIGRNSFTKKKNGVDSSYSGNFYLKNCPKVNELKIGYYSFSTYKVIGVENVSGLDVIEMGGYVFYYASLELKSVLVLQ